MDEQKPAEALELLEPLLADHPQVGRLNAYVGHARLLAGNSYGAVDAFEQAATLLDHAEDWVNFASVCLGLTMSATALPALRRALSLHPPPDKVRQLENLVAMIEEEVHALASKLGIPDREAERGLRTMHDGDRALQRGDYPASIAASQSAAAMLEAYPPPLNNLSLALFYDGQPQRAIATAKRVVELDPVNTHALSNLIRFLAWTGQEDDARELWPTLRAIQPKHEGDRHKIAEAAAALGDDEGVFAVLEPLGQTQDGSLWSLDSRRLLAVAEANLGRHREAADRLRRLGPSAPYLEAFMPALEAGRPGIGWADRYPYYSIFDLVPGERLLNLGVLWTSDSEPSSEGAKRTISEFAKRYPQIVRVAEKMIWEEQKPAAAIPLLAAIGTPEAHEVLRRFGISQAGPDQPRLDALTQLVDAGLIAEGEECRVWLKGEWRSVVPSSIQRRDRAEHGYAPEVAALLATAELALADEDFEAAEKFLRQVLELEPAAKEAYNNLATIYMRREDVAQATAMFEAALRIDPLYVFPRASLALLRLREEDVGGAKEIVAPLADAPAMSDLAQAFYSYTLARISVAEDDHAAARAHLSVSLNAIPNYGIAVRLVEALDEYDAQIAQYDQFKEEQRQRWARRRAALQAAISTETPSLHDALSIHTKGSLTAMARLTPVASGWSTLRKAQLLKEIEHALRDEGMFGWFVTWLGEEEREALKTVLDCGGSMGWDAFDAEFGNDLDEYPHWDYETPETTMGLLRARGLLAEAIVDGELIVTIPVELRPLLEAALGQRKADL